MNAINDLILSREAQIGLITFLHSEKQRHAEDIKFIDKGIAKLIKRNKITGEELAGIKKASVKYLKF